MAVTSNVKIVQIGDGQMDRVQMTVATATVFAAGDFVELTDNTSTVTAAATPTTVNTLFVGPTVTGSTNSSNVPLTVMILCNVRVLLNSSSGAMSFGEAALVHLGANGTVWEFSKNAAEGCVWALEEIAAAAIGLFRVDVSMMDVSVFEALTT